MVDPRTWRRASRAAAALFGSWKKWSNCAKLGKSQKLLQKNSRFFLFSICFFSFFFQVFFVFESNLTKSKSCKNYCLFFCFFSCFFFVFFFRFCSKYFRSEKSYSIYFRIIFGSQKQFISFSNYFRITFRIGGAIATVIFATLAGFVATS